MKTTADVIYSFASQDSPQYPFHYASSHTATLTRLPHKSHSPPTSSDNCLRSPGSTSTAPRKCRCTVFQFSRTSRHWQQCNTRHSLMRCLTEWAQARPPLRSQSPSWPDPEHNMRNQARDSHSCFRLQRQVSSRLRLSISTAGRGDRYQHTTWVPRVELRKRDSVRRLNVSAGVSRLHGIILFTARDFAGGSRAHRHSGGSGGSRRLG